MPTPFPITLVTPERILYAGETEEAALRTDGGEITFLARHEDYIGAVDIGTVRLTGATGPESQDQGELRAAVHGGFVHVNSEGVTILATVAELAAEIDVERARRALEQAESASPHDSPQEAVEHADGEPSVTSDALLALVAPDDPSVAARRARARLAAAGASSAS